MISTVVIIASTLLVGTSGFTSTRLNNARHTSSLKVMNDRSIALPFDPRPINLDGKKIKCFFLYYFYL